MMNAEQAEFHKKKVVRIGPYEFCCLPLRHHSV